MSEYTPTTAEVKSRYYSDYWWRVDGADANSFYSEFDRWLAQHDEEVAAKAKDEVANDELKRIVRLLEGRVIFCHTSFALHDELPGLYAALRLVTGNN